MPSYEEGLARTSSHFGLILLGLGRSAEAEGVLRKAVGARAAMAAARPESTKDALDLGGSLVNLGMALGGQGRLEPALEQLTRAIGTLEPAHRREPGNANLGLFLRNAHVNRAQVLDLLGRDAESDADWDRALALTPAMQRWKVSADRVSSRAGRGIGGELRAAMTRARRGETASALAKLLPLIPRADEAEAGVRYDLACALAVCSEAVRDDEKRDPSERVLEADGLAAQAIDLLRRLHADGFFRPEAARDLLRHDANLAPLRRLAPLRDLLRDLAFPTDPFMR